MDRTVYSYDNIHETIFSMQLNYTDFLHKPMYIAGSRTITVCVLPVWPIVLHGKMLLHISVQWPTAMQYFHIPDKRNSQVVFCDFANLQDAYLTCTFFEKTLDFPQFSHNQAYFPPIYLKTTPCDKLKMKIVKFLFNRRF